MIGRTVIHVIDERIQALPGPLFSFSAFLGAATKLSIAPQLGAAVAIVSIFTPSFLLVLGSAPYWSRIRAAARAQSVLAAINAAVVGLLVAALYRPIGSSTLHTMGDAAFAIVALCALTVGRVPPWAVVLAGALTGMLLA